MLTLGSKSNSNEVAHVLPTPVASSPEALLAYLGDASELLNSVWPSGQTSSEQESQDESQKVLHTFTKIYRAHYDKMINAMSSLNFQEVETIWHSFWQCINRSDGPGRSSLCTCTCRLYFFFQCLLADCLSIECVKELTKTTFTTWIAQTDYTMYNAIISSLLLPNLLKPIPQILTQQIRNFAKCINKWMASALQGYDGKSLFRKFLR